MDQKIIKVAIAASGLGHVTRGMEAWAESLAGALHKQGADVTLFRGAGPAKNDYDVVLPCIKRSSRFARVGDALNHVGGWRLGLGSSAQVESFSYGVGLLRHLRKGCDVVHVKQGSLAIFLDRASKLGLLDTPVIFANGQIVDSKTLSRFRYVQHLSSYEKERMADAAGEHGQSYVIPNVVDIEAFCPGDKAEARSVLGLPQDAFIVLTVGALKKQHKRMDHFISEMARVLALQGTGLHFVMAGARDKETAELEEVGRSLLADNLSIFSNLSFEQMPTLYRAADVFVLCSLFEAFGTVMVEAMASGVPVICNTHPIMKWIVGEGGMPTDLQKPGVLAEAVRKYADNPQMREEQGSVGMDRTKREFSLEAVASKTLEMYRDVIAHHRNGGSRN